MRPGRSVRLNELGRRSAFEETLLAREASGLGAAIDPSRVILTGTTDDLARFIDGLSSASVGISGIRGIGKSTLIRWLCTERNASRRLPVLGMYVTAPVEYDARDFLGKSSKVLWRELSSPRARGLGRVPAFCMFLSR